MQITIQRRHTKNCPSYAKGPHYMRCGGKRPCILRAFGYDDAGKRVRESLRTRDLGRAPERLKVLIDRLRDQPTPRAPRKTIAEAVEAFHARHASKAPETVRK